MTLKIDVINLEEPNLEFGLDGEHFDPKVGLLQSGPLSLRFGSAHQSKVKVGLVGPKPIIEHAHKWFERCQKVVPSLSNNQVRYPDFPGFNTVFRSSLEFASIWEWEFFDEKLKGAFEQPSQQSRFNAVLDLYVQGIRSLYDNREIKPDVVVACISDDIIQRCRNVRTPGLTRQEQKLVQQQAAGQITLPGLEEFTSIEDSLLYRDFRRALKAHAMEIGVPIQIGTDNLFLDKETNQDAATRAWNVSLALFYKAGGIPWRLKELSQNTCYVGISFHYLRTKKRHLIFSSLAQAFPSTGEGFVLRGDAIPWQNDNEDRNPHLSAEQSAKLAEQVLEQYRQRVGIDPLRIVFYKTTHFNDSELTGFGNVLNRIPRAEMVNLRSSEFRLIRRGAYPPKRGTIVTVNNSASFLFTNGYFQYWGTYVGAHIPVPYEVTTLGDTDITQVCSDVMGLTKLNWNTTQAFSSVPIPLHFAKEVGSIMSHYAEFKGEEAQPRPSYKFYM